MHWQIALGVALALFVHRARSRSGGARRLAVGNNDIEFWIISNRIMPPIVAVLPIYVMFQQLRLLDTQVALIATYTAVNLPIVVWLTRDFFAAIPLDLEESAEIDGASKFRVFFTIALPLVRSGLVATFLLVLILAWNEYLLALFLSNAKAQTMPVLVSAQNTTRGPQWWNMSVLIVVMIAPVVVIASRPAEAHRARPAGRRGEGLERMRVTLSEIHKSFGAVAGGQGARPRDRRRRVPGAARPFRLRQDDGAAHGRRAGIGDLGPHPDRRPRRHPRAAEISRRRDGVPVLRALPAHDGGGEHRLSAEAARRRRRPSATPRSAGAAGKVHLEDYLDRYPRQLSGGQRQRVALARAMVRRPSVFLMDEPLSNLDAKLRGYMRSELKRLQADLGVTTIYVTHDQIEAMTLAHRVAIMNKGVVQQIAAPREIYDDPANLFVAGFIGSPPMNFLQGELVERQLRLPGGQVSHQQHREPGQGHRRAAAGGLPRDRPGGRQDRRPRLCRRADRRPHAGHLPVRRRDR